MLPQLSREVYLLPLGQRSGKLDRLVTLAVVWGGLLFQAAPARDPSKRSLSPVNHSRQGWWNVFPGEAHGFCMGGLGSVSIYERHKFKDIESPS